MERERERACAAADPRLPTLLPESRESSKGTVVHIVEIVVPAHVSHLSVSRVCIIKRGRASEAGRLEWRQDSEDASP